MTVAFLHFTGLDSARRPVTGRGCGEPRRTGRASSRKRSIRAASVSSRTDVDADGGKIILTAGAPRRFRRRTRSRCSLALREIVERQPPLPLQHRRQRAATCSPATSGPTLPPELHGDGRRGEPRGAGDGRAPQPGADPRDRVGARQTPAPCSRPTRCEPFLVKGKRRPVTAFSVGPARGVRAEVARRGTAARRSRRRISAAFVARHRRADVRARRRRSRSSATPARASPGSSARSSAASRRHAGAHRVQCRLYQAATPYFPIGQLLEGLIGVCGRFGRREPRTCLEQVVSVGAPQLRPWLPLIGIPLGLGARGTPKRSPAR